MKETKSNNVCCLVCRLCSFCSYKSALKCFTCRLRKAHKCGWYWRRYTSVLNPTFSKVVENNQLSQIHPYMSELRLKP